MLSYQGGAVNSVSLAHAYQQPAFRASAFVPLPGPTIKVQPKFSKVISAGVDVLREALASTSRSLTALGNGANAFFAQISAALAMDRAAESMKALYTRQSRPQPLFATTLSMIAGLPFAPFKIIDTAPALANAMLESHKLGSQIVMTLTQAAFWWMTPMVPARVR